jgi:chemotaxis methyl-accepting protein methylase
MQLMHDIIKTDEPKKPLRIASVGCSTGKEPYSLLMVSWQSRDKLVIDGYDINPFNIKQAKQGIYPMYDSSGSTESELENFSRFRDSPDAGGGSIEHLCRITSNGSKQYRKYIMMNDEAKSKVQFYVHDFIENPLPRPPAPYDFVLMLNVLLHYPAEGRHRLLANASESMISGGILFTDQVLGIPMPAFFKETDRYGTAKALKGEYPKFKVLQKA